MEERGLLWEGEGAGREEEGEGEGEDLWVVVVGLLGGTEEGGVLVLRFGLLGGTGGREGTEEGGGGVVILDNLSDKQVSNLVIQTSPFSFGHVLGVSLTSISGVIKYIHPFFYFNFPPPPFPC